MAHRLNPANPPPKRSRIGALALGVFVFVVISALVLQGQRLISTRRQAQQELQMLAFANSFRAQLAEQLGSILGVLNGIKAYLLINHADLDGEQFMRLLALSHDSVDNVRSFGLAIGYQLQYVYPLQGNEKLIGTYYPDVDSQWPQILLAIERDQMLITGPLQLLQGGEGLIYRIPIKIDGEYWALLSSAIATPELFHGALRNASQGEPQRVALRGRDTHGVDGPVFYGDAALFDDPRSVLLDMQVSGGLWRIAVGAPPPPGSPWALALGELVAVILGLLSYVLALQHARLRRQTLYDTLTGLPNRLLLEDRFELMIELQQRSIHRSFAVLYIELDAFETIHARYGRRNADRVLLDLIQQLRSVIRGSDSLGRWDSNALVVITGLMLRDGLPELVERVRRCLQAPVDINGERLALTASIGSAIYLDDGSSFGQLIGEARARMADARRHQSTSEDAATPR